MSGDLDARDVERVAREVLALEYEAAPDPQGDSPRFHAANVRAIGRRDYGDWKDLAALRAMRVFADEMVKAETDRCVEQILRVEGLIGAGHGSSIDNAFRAAILAMRNDDREEPSAADAK